MQGHSREVGGQGGRGREGVQGYLKEVGGTEGGEGSGGDIIIIIGIFHEYNLL